MPIFGGKKEKKSKSVTTVQQILTEADNLLKAGDLDKAASEYRRAHRYLYNEEGLAEAPDDFSALFTKTGHGLFETGEPDRAIECFDKATQLNPKNVEAWMSRGIVHLKTKTMLNYAVMCFNEVLKLEPSNIEALENQAEAMMLGKKKDQAVKIYQKLAEISPDNKDYKKKLAELSPPLTMSAINEQLKKNPKDINLWRAKTEMLLREGKTAEAIETYLKIGYLEKKPDAYEKVLTLNPKNRTAIDKLLDFRPDDMALLEKKAGLLESLGQMDEVIEIYNKLGDLDPTNEKYAAKLKEFEPDEMETLDTALSSDPNNLDALSRKAALLEERGNAKGAAGIYMRLVKLAPENTDFLAGALKSKPNDLDLLNAKGDIHFGKEEYDEALECFRKIAEILPKDVTALHNKGAVLFKLNKFDEAVATFDQLLALDANDITAYLTKGAALFKAGKFEDSIQALNNVVKRQPGEPAAWYYKACAEARRGNTKPIVPFLTRAIEIDMEFKERAKGDECFLAVKEMPEFKALVG